MTKKFKRPRDNPWDPDSYFERPPSVFDDCAPEHVRDAQAMSQDYPRDEKGRRIPDSRRDIVVDARPPILVPPRPTYLNRP